VRSKILTLSYSTSVCSAISWVFSASWAVAYKALVVASKTLCDSELQYQRQLHKVSHDFSFESFKASPSSLASARVCTIVRQSATSSMDWKLYPRVAYGLRLEREGDSLVGILEDLDGLGQGLAGESWGNAMRMETAQNFKLGRPCMHAFQSCPECVIEVAPQPRGLLAADR
jgi:hypothetical protein